MKICTNFLNLLKVCMCVALAFAALETRAQGEAFTVSGTVKDASGQPVIGATVFDTTTQKGDVTSTTGSFSLQVVPGSVLKVSFVGYAEQSAKVVAGKTTYDFVLESDALEIEELVVVGYGTQKKVNLTGAIATVDDTQLASRSAPSVAHMLQGAVPGLTISTTSGRPGNSADLNIRGITSINGGSPLVLVDGAEGDLMKINPNDVASISVIKDASAAAIYGARAAYGVVLVTTKEGDDSGKTRVSYSGRWGWNAPTTSTDYETRGYNSVYVNDLFWHADAGTNYTNYTEQDMMELWARRNDKLENPERAGVKIAQRDGRDTYLYYAKIAWFP